MNQYQELDEAILGLTGSQQWKALVTVLEAENAASIQNQLEAKSWDEVNYQMGYREALRFVYQVREHTKALMESQDAVL